VIALRLALRELRGGLSGLRLLAVCLVLGVAALAGVGSLSSAITTGLSDRGQLILGGDIAAQLTQRRATDAERAGLAALGRVSEVVRLRAMTGRAGSDDRTLAEVKAVDAAYPLYSALRLANGAALVPGSVAVAPALAERYGLHAGDRLEIGSGVFRVAGVIADEPDATGDGFGFGPRVLMRSSDLAATGLLEPGSLFRASYRVKLPAAISLKAATAKIRQRLPDTGWTLSDRSNGAAGTRQFVDRLGQFLTLVGLTALVVAGVGVGNGVTAYLAGKSTTIAALKTMGAGSALIFQSYLLQIGIVALGAVCTGAGIGAALPWVIVLAAGDALPVPPALGIYPAPLLTAAAYGVLIAAAFAITPLARARDLPAARLLRDSVEPPRWPGAVVAALVALAGAGMILYSLRFSSPPRSGWSCC
jgi:putative ABC transport system permease protein